MLICQGGSDLRKLSVLAYVRSVCTYAKGKPANLRVSGGAHCGRSRCCSWWDPAASLNGFCLHSRTGRIT